MSEKAFEALVDGVKSSRRLLDNLGITIKMRELPSWNERCKRQELLYGSGFFSRLWCNLRRYLEPKLYAQLVEDYETVKLQTQAEMMNAVLEKGNGRTSTKS
jgi:hypothetical protein